MNTQALVPFASLLAYCGLFALNLCYGHSRASRRFVLFLLMAMAWSLSSLLLCVHLLSAYADVWGRVFCVSIFAMTVAYYHLVQSVQSHRAGPAVYAGYFVVGGFVALAFFGYVPQGVMLSSVSDGMVHLDRGPLYYPLGLLSAAYIGLAIVSLVQRYRSITSALERTRILYLLAGIAVLTLFALSNLSDTMSARSIDQLGNVANSSLIGYAIMRHRLLDISLAIRRGLVYSATTLCVAVPYFFSIFFMSRFFKDWQIFNQILAIGVVAILAAVFHTPLTHGIQKFVDRLFLGDRYDYRQMLVGFPTAKRNTLDLEELAQSMLQITTKAMGAKQASLLLPERGAFVAYFASGSQRDEPLTFVKLNKDNSILGWVKRESSPVSRELTELDPGFKALWEAEGHELDAVGCELLCPLMRNEEMIGILALGEKERGGIYTSEDLDLLKSLAGDVASMVENALRHSTAKMQANSDEVTGIFNHRFFHDRLDAQLQRSSRFGLSFSLVMFDIDLFKAYNGAYGHQAGDLVLRQVAECIRNSTRRNDLAFRYGGEEFAVILPQAGATEAYNVAERVRKAVEARMEKAGILLTVSAGVATWPNDAVDSGDLVRSVEAALYYAKQTGRNCTRLASDVPSLVLPRLATGGWGGTLSLVYALAATVDAKDHYTYGHSRKVSRYAVTIGEAMGLSEARIAILRNSGLLHDIGKIGVPDAVLRKPGRLNDEEWKQILSHPELGASILRHLDQLSVCLPAITHHHERFDGSGYPLGLHGEAIPLEARILTVADAYDAMTSARSYRGAMSSKQATDELFRNSGTQFDPQVVQAFAYTERSAPRQELTLGFQREAVLSDFT